MNWRPFLPILAACLCLADGLGAVADQPMPVVVARPGVLKPAAKKDAKEGQEQEKEAKREPERYFAVTGATVHTVTGPVLDGPTILCKNGKISAIGHDLEIPKDAERLDAKGYHVYPGLVAVESRMVLGRESPEDSTDVYSLSLTLALAGGITTAATGNTAAKLTYGTLEDHLVKRELFFSLQYSGSKRKEIRDSLERARQYLRDLAAYEEQKKRDPQAKKPADLKGNDQQALKLLRHEIVAISDADTAPELTELVDLAQQYQFQLVVRGATEGWIAAPAMGRAGIRAIISPRTRRDWDETTNRPNGSSIENAKILYEHGVLLAIVPRGWWSLTMGIAGRDLSHLTMEAAFAVRGGLPDEAAVRAITIDAARILGIDDRVGSIEIGKDADFAIVDGDILHYMTLVRWTVVNGRVAYDKQKDSLLEHIRPEGNLDAPPPVDYWPRRLGAEW